MNKSVESVRIMYILTILFAILCVIQCIHSALPFQRSQTEKTGLTVYDQKQSGSYNIHLNIKDVAIIALSNDHAGSDIDSFGPDYYDDYDVSDFTVKPLQGLIGIDSSTSTKPPPIIHSEPDGELENFNLTELNIADEATTSSTDVVLITSSTLKPFNSTLIASNKTQNVIILNQDRLDSTIPGIVVTTPTPSAESLPVKIDPSVTTEVEKITQAANHTALFDKNIYSSFPDQIPVQVVLDAPNLRRQSDLTQNKFKAKATPARRRITPPADFVYENRDNSNSNSESKIKYVRRRPCSNGNCARRPSGM